MKRIISVMTICYLLFPSFPVKAQHKRLMPLKIGDKVPRSLWKSVPKNKGTELVILDFWNTHCGTCIEAFPKMEKLQKMFLNKLTVILVNAEEQDAEIKKRLELINRGKAFFEEPFVVLPGMKMINGPGFLSKLFPRYSVPHHVWLNGSGVVKAITYDHNATAQHIEDLLSGKNVQMTVKDDIAAEKALRTGFMIPSIETTAPVFYSCLTTSNNGSYGINMEDTARGTFRASVSASVLSLLERAYYNDSTHNRVIIEATNPKQYETPKNDNLIDEWRNKYFFTYELQGMLKDKETWMQKMQEDVNQFFGSMFGIEATVETRKFKSLVLVRNSKVPISNNGGREWRKMSDSLYEFKNTPFASIVSLLSWSLESMPDGIAFIDETGIDENFRVDFQLKGDLKNLLNLQAQLKLYGLEIIQTERTLKALVIRDKCNKKKE